MKELTHCQNRMSPEDTPTIVPNSGELFATPSQVGERFGDYELISEIARGGMGVVYKARHTKLNRVVALKMILGGRFSSADDIQRFQMEAAAAARLDHSGIVSVYDIGEHEGQAYFAMKYVEGGSLGDHMDALRGNPGEAARLLVAVARSVHHGHVRGILHRDLKPANILIADDGEPLVTDYGLAKSTGDESNITKTGAVVGTPSYMSPEQAAGSNNLTTATDVYAIGAMLYELLTGRPPHKDETPVKTVMSVINDSPQPPSHWNRSVDRDLELICLKCIERDPEERYPSADAIAHDLEAWIDGKPISVQPPSGIAVMRRWLKENRRVAFSALAMVIGLLFSLPFLIGFFGNKSVSFELYEKYFPEAERPWYEPLTNLPHWVDDISMAFLAIVVWPSLGLWTAIVTRPKTIVRAIGVGSLISAILLLIAFVTLSWMVVLVSSVSHSESTIRILGDAVWASGDEIESAKTAANELYEGLENVPSEARADVVADRVFHEQTATVVYSLFIAGLIGVLLAVPIVIGTVIGKILLDRGHGFLLLGLRYAIAWLASYAVLVIIYAYVYGARTQHLDVTYFWAHVAIISISSLTLWLTLRRWHRNERPVDVTVIMNEYSTPAEQPVVDT